MRLTQWTDYTLRVLMYCAANLERVQPVTISEIALNHGISRSHLTKIVQELAALSWLETTRGRGGGMRLLVPANAISVGDIVRATETDFHMVECFEPTQNQCRMSSYCQLKTVLHQATEAYFSVLNATTLADLVASYPSATTDAKFGLLQPIPLPPSTPAVTGP
jgi:Rrf2 family nitric oxide-sensitive transcriptional repressor